MQAKSLPVFRECTGSYAFDKRSLPALQSDGSDVFCRIRHNGGGR